METSIDRETFLQADAVFVTNALQEVRVVKSYEHVDFKIAHPLIDRLRKELAGIVFVGINFMLRQVRWSVNRCLHNRSR